MAEPIEAAAAADEAARTLVIERMLPAPPERVFRAWTDPAFLVRWWGPEGFTTAPGHAIDIRPGGSYRTTMVSQKGESHTVSGTYREIAPPRRLVFTWGWERDGQRGHETIVEITLEPAGDGTRLRLVQRLFQSAEQATNHRMGWTSSLNDLERVLRSTAA
jgi:uncharacterized protein YndB with AHSA1/START domain